MRVVLSKKAPIYNRELMFMGDILRNRVYPRVHRSVASALWCFFLVAESVVGLQRSLHVVKESVPASDAKDERCCGLPRHRGSILKSARLHAAVSPPNAGPPYTKMHKIAGHHPSTAEVQTKWHPTSLHVVQPIALTDIEGPRDCEIFPPARW